MLFSKFFKSIWSMIHYASSPLTFDLNLSFLTLKHMSSLSIFKSNLVSNVYYLRSSSIIFNRVSSSSITPYLLLPLVNIIIGLFPIFFLKKNWMILWVFYAEFNMILGYIWSWVYNSLFSVNNLMKLFNSPETRI